MDLPYICDYAKSSRAICRGCEIKIVKNTARIAIMLQGKSFDGLVPNWYHFHCFFIEHMPQSTMEVQNFNSLNWEDRQEMESIISKGESPYASAENRIKMKRVISEANSKASINDYKIDYSKNSLTKCEICSTPINKSQVRICKHTPKKKQWYHVKCFVKIRTSIDFLECGSVVSGFDALSSEDQEDVIKQLPNMSEVPPKKLKVSTATTKIPIFSDEDQQMKENIKVMRDYRDILKANLKKRELELLLRENLQSTFLKFDTMLDIASEMMTFGALERCRYCLKGQLIYNNFGYKCIGGKPENWTKCIGFHDDPIRSPVEIPQDLRLKYTFLYEYEYVARKRILPKVRPDQIISGPLKSKNFVIVGMNEEDTALVSAKIKILAGHIASEVRRSVFAVITTKKEVENDTDDIKTAKACQVYVVCKHFLNDIICNEPFSLDDVARRHSLVTWGTELHNRIPEKYLKTTNNSHRRTEEEEEGKRRMVIKGGVAIEPDSGLADIAHVYQSGPVKFNAVLSRTDVVTNKNSYYKIQLLESDNFEEYWVYRAWGRIGTNVGSYNVKKMESLSKAKSEFTECFKLRTGYTWENRHTMTKKPGLFVMLDVDYEISKKEIIDLRTFVADSILNPSIAELMAIIFNVQAMEKIMLEYELDLEKLPLGKLSRSQIKSAYSILNQAQWALLKKKLNSDDIISYTNMFYSHMPQNAALERPPLLDNIEIIKKKSEMLANLMEMETAYAMIQRGAKGEGRNILDAYYSQLNTDMEVLREDSEEFRLIQEYVNNTHGDTHRYYDLKILDIYKVFRHGESERYTPFKKLRNRRLLWHGSRTTNFAGILSQGLRIAPPEAPMSGYMFGKGIYFADMVSKSANYCFTKPDDTVGLLLLCEVALGNISNELRAKAITNLPKKYNSVRGIGRTEPNPEAMKVLEDGVQVPLGTPVIDLDATGSLLYNEYIVYDPAQVNIKYLLKMDFKYKNK